MDFKLKLKILIVDDNVAFTKLFSKLIYTALEKDFIIELLEVAYDGAECLEKLKNNTFDIVFMDVEMPNINGIEATTFITEHLRGVKVFAVSFNNDLEKIQRMLEAGARNYLIKEKITPEIIYNLLKKYPFGIH